MSDLKFTPGPWLWSFNRIGGVSLLTPDRGRLYVMDFGRKGMQGASPRFSQWSGPERGRQGGIMLDAADYLSESGSIDHPDAHLIAAAPDMYSALCRAVNVLSGDEMSKSALVRSLESARSALAKARGES